MASVKVGRITRRQSPQQSAASAGGTDMDAELKKLKADRDGALHYAAILYAISRFNTGLTTKDRAQLASAIVATQRERGLID
jgi:hypothetical protein